MTLMTFHPAPRKMPSSSWMILPLPRTGPSSRWRLQLMTQVRLSSFSRPARPMHPSDSGSSHSPSPRNAQTRTSSVSREAAVAQVAVVPRVVDRHDRAEAHADGRVLPEVRHQPRVRVARKPAARVQFLAEVLELRLVEPAFDERAGVHAGAGVALEEDDVAGVRLGAAAEEVVEADLVERGGAGEGRDVAADVGVLVRLQHHRHRVPADDALDAPFEFAVAGERGLLLRPGCVLT